MKLGILLCGQVPDEMIATDGDYTTLYSAMFPGRGFTVDTYAVHQNQFPTGPVAAEAWLVTGSKHGAYEDHAWIPPLEALLRDIRAANAPMVGICFGHQIIAQAFGGTVEKWQGGWTVGRQDYTIGGQTLGLYAWHQDQVTAPPKDATHLGHSTTAANAILAYGDHILTLQPHPEFPPRAVDTLIQYRSATVPEALKTAAKASLSAPNDNAKIHQWLGDVLEGKPATDIPFAVKASA